MASSITLTAATRTNLTTLTQFSKAAESLQQRLSTQNRVNTALDQPEAYFKAKSIPTEPPAPPKDPAPTGDTNPGTDPAKSAELERQRERALANLLASFGTPETSGPSEPSEDGGAADEATAVTNPLAPAGKLAFGSNPLDETSKGLTAEIMSKFSLADQNAEGANLIALQTRQQLGTQSLALAGQQQQSILNLLR